MAASGRSLVVGLDGARPSRRRGKNGRSLPPRSGCETGRDARPRQDGMSRNETDRHQLTGPGRTRGMRRPKKINSWLVPLRFPPEISIARRDVGNTAGSIQSRQVIRRSRITVNSFITHLRHTSRSPPSPLLIRAWRYGRYLPTTHATADLPTGAVRGWASDIRVRRPRRVRGADPFPRRWAVGVNRPVRRPILPGLQSLERRTGGAFAYLSPLSRRRLLPVEEVLAREDGGGTGETFEAVICARRRADRRTDGRTDGQEAG